MSNIWNKDGSAKSSSGSRPTGGKQTHSVFGWANEKAEKPTTEARSQSERAMSSKLSDKQAAGVRTVMTEAPNHKVAESKIRDMQGHNIFAHSPVGRFQCPLYTPSASFWEQAIESNQ